MEAEFSHLPVMVREVVELLLPVPEGLIVDCTVGGAGHSSALLDARPDLHLLGIDRDADAVDAARSRLARFGERAQVVQGGFEQLAELVERYGEGERVMGILMDLGVSSPQLDRPERGFSYRFDAPLDMRMDAKQALTAADVVNGYDVEELADVIVAVRRGALRPSHRARHRRRPAAAHDARARRRDPRRDPGRAARRRARIPPRRTFQAIRMEVNRELPNLADGLDDSVHVIGPEGRVLVLAYHSLEDRMVKETLRGVGRRRLRRPRCRSSRSPNPSATRWCACSPGGRSGRVQTRWPPTGGPRASVCARSSGCPARHRRHPELRDSIMTITHDAAELARARAVSAARRAARAQRRVRERERPVAPARRARRLRRARASARRRRRARFAVFGVAAISAASMFLLVAFHVFAAQSAFSSTSSTRELRRRAARSTSCLRDQVATLSSPETVVAAAARARHGAPADVTLLHVARRRVGAVRPPASAADARPAPCPGTVRQRPRRTPPRRRRRHAGRGRPRREPPRVRAGVRRRRGPRRVRRRIPRAASACAACSCIVVFGALAVRVAQLQVFSGDRYRLAVVEPDRAHRAAARAARHDLRPQRPRPRDVDRADVGLRRPAAGDSTRSRTRPSSRRSCTSTEPTLARAHVGHGKLRVPSTSRTRVDDNVVAEVQQARRSRASASCPSRRGSTRRARSRAR